MKKYLLMLATLVAAMTAFSSCSDDDNNAPARPTAIADGEIPAKNFFLFVDGKYVPTSLDTKTTISGTSSRAIENEGTLQLKSTAIYTTKMDANGEFDKISPVIELNVTKDKGDYVLNGETTADGYTYTVTGQVTGNHAGENDYIIKVNRTKLPAPANKLAGKILKLELSKYYNNSEVECNDPELSQWSMQLLWTIQSKLTTKTKYKDVYLKFIDNENYEYWYTTEEETGEGDKKETKKETKKDGGVHRYMLNGTTICFIDDADFASVPSDLFSFKSEDKEFATPVSENFAQRSIITDMGNHIPSNVTKMELSKNFVFNNIFALKNGFFSHFKFGKPEDFEKENNKKHLEALLKLQTGEKDGSVRSVFGIPYTEVDEIPE